MGNFKIKTPCGYPSTSVYQAHCWALLTSEALHKHRHKAAVSSNIFCHLFLSVEENAICKDITQSHLLLCHIFKMFPLQMHDLHHLNKSRDHSEVLTSPEIFLSYILKDAILLLKRFLY